MHLSPSSLVFLRVFRDFKPMCQRHVAAVRFETTYPPRFEQFSGKQQQQKLLPYYSPLQNRKISFHRDVLGHVIHLNSSVSEILLMFLYPCVQVFVTLRERKRRSEWRRNAKENDPQQAISRVISLTTGAAAQVQSFDKEQY